MGKRGPCCHCGITNTPLWRNGPPGKPVLCNACGSRWRTKGTLANYVPLHALKFPPEDKRNSQYPKFSSKRKLESVCEMSPSEGSLEVEETLPEYDRDATDLEDESGNRSGSGSGISASESCVQLGSMDGNDISGSAQSRFWDSHVPSRKRTGIEYQSASPIEKLRQDLYGILQEQESSCLSGPSEEVLLFERQDPTVSIETGLGSVLIRHPLSSGEESEESSHMKENKISYLNDTCMRSAFVHASSQSCKASSSPVDKDRMIQNIEGMEEMKERHAKRRALADRSSENTLLGNLNIQLNVAAQNGSMKNQSHISTNLHLPRGSLNTVRASVARQPKGHMRHVWSNSNIKLSILPPGSRQKLHCARIDEDSPLEGSDVCKMV